MTSPIPFSHLGSSMAISPGLPSILIVHWPPGFAHEIGGAQQRMERTRICPPAIEERICHGTFGDVCVVDVRDFELVAAGRLARGDLLEDRGVIHINAGDREI